MKLLITSIDAIIDNKTGVYFPGIKKALKDFERANEDNSVVIISISEKRLDAIPNDFQKLPIRGDLRKSNELINIIVKHTKLDFNDIFILGAKDDDFILAANAKVILLTADYAKENNPNERIYTEKYGVAIYTPERLTSFFDHYLQLDKPWFYSLQIDDQTTLYGLTDAMTNKQDNRNVRDICESLKSFLKHGNETNKNPFLIYALMSIYRIFKEMSDINYWGYYPSAAVGENAELKNLKEILRKSFKSSRTDHDILIRNTTSPQRKLMSEAARVQNGCDSQFQTIHINPWFKGKIEGKNVCIIDDFTNHGSSCETVRHLLKMAGVNKIIFISLGKFRYDYKMYDYTLKGDVFKSQGYTFSHTGYETLSGTVNNSSSRELLNALNDLIK